MCEPTTIAYAVTAAVGLFTAHRSAEAQEEAMKQQQKVQEDEIADRAGVEMTQRAQAARAERARLRAVSAESGLAGVSVTELLDNIDFQAGTDMANMEANRYNATRSSRSSANSALSRIEQPDYLGAIAGLGVTAYENDLFDKKPKPEGGV